MLSELPFSYLNAAFRQAIVIMAPQPEGLIMPCGVIERRAVSLFQAAEQGELRDAEDFSPDLFYIQVHPAGIVFKDAESEGFSREVPGVFGGVIFPDSDKTEQARAYGSF